MDEKDKGTSFQQNMTNYDYVWGSDQDEYVKKNKTSDETADEVSEQQQSQT
ncbi:hypothetical protein D3C78_1118440 [compost metagenome]